MFYSTRSRLAAVEELRAGKCDRSRSNSVPSHGDVSPSKNSEQDMETPRKKLKFNGDESSSGAAANANGKGKKSGREKTAQGAICTDIDWPHFHVTGAEQRPAKYHGSVRSKASPLQSIEPVS